MRAEDILERSLDFGRGDGVPWETVFVRGCRVLLWDGWMGVEEGAEGVEG